MEPIVINLTDLTKGVVMTDLSGILLITHKQNVSLKKISSVSEASPDVLGKDLSDMAKAAISQKFNPVYVVGTQGASDAATAEEVIALLDTLDISPYYVASTFRDVTSVKALAKYQGAKISKYVAELEPTTIASAYTSAAADINSKNTILMAHKGVSDGLDGTLDVYADSAIIGKMASVLEGTAPWFYQSLDGIPDGGFSKSDVDILDEGNVMTVTTYMKRIETWCGKTTAGTFIHNEILKDWLTVRLKEALAKVIHNDAGVLLDDDGLASITSAAKEVFNDGKVNRGVIESYTLITPRREDIPENNRANGHVDQFKAIVKFKGFIKTVVYNVVAEV